MEENCECRSTDGYQAVYPDILEVLAALIKHHGEVGSYPDRGVEHGTAQSDIFPVEHGAGADVRGRNNEAVNSLFLPNASFLFGLREEEEGQKEGADRLSQDSLEKKLSCAAFISVPGLFDIVSCFCVIGRI